MIIKASATLRNDYSTISNLARSTSEPIYITKNGEGDGVFMNISRLQQHYETIILLFPILQGQQVNRFI